MICPSVTELVKRHPNPEKTKGMVGLSVEPNRLNPKSFGLNILKDDGTKVDISWRICLSKTPKTSNEKLAGAMRFAISDQILDFRKKNTGNHCTHCGDEFGNGIVPHIHHSKCEFKDLMKNFIKVCGRQIPLSFDDDPSTHQKKFKLLDYEFEKDWCKYHKKLAVLQLVCKHCNLVTLR